MGGWNVVRIPLLIPVTATEFLFGVAAPLVGYGDGFGHRVTGPDRARNPPCPTGATVSCRGWEGTVDAVNVGTRQVDWMATPRPPSTGCASSASRRRAVHVQLTSGSAQRGLYTRWPGAPGGTPAQAVGRVRMRAIESFRLLRTPARTWWDTWKVSGRPGVPADPWGYALWGANPMSTSVTPRQHRPAAGRRGWGRDVDPDSAGGTGRWPSATGVRERDARRTDGPGNLNGEWVNHQSLRPGVTGPERVVFRDSALRWAPRPRLRVRNRYGPGPRTSLTLHGEGLQHCDPPYWGLQSSPFENVTGSPTHIGEGGFFRSGRGLLARCLAVSGEVR